MTVTTAVLSIFVDVTVPRIVRRLPRGVLIRSSSGLWLGFAFVCRLLLGSARFVRLGRCFCACVSRPRSRTVEDRQDARDVAPLRRERARSTSPGSCTDRAGAGTARRACSLSCVRSSSSGRSRSFSRLVARLAHSAPPAATRLRLRPAACGGRDGTLPSRSLRVHAFDLEDHAARLDDRDPTFDAALTGTHAGLGRLLRERAGRGRRGRRSCRTSSRERDDRDASRFDLTRGEPARRLTWRPKSPNDTSLPPLARTARAALLHLAELGPLGRKHRHGALPQG